MTKNVNKRSKHTGKLPIPPIVIRGKTRNIHVSQIVSGKIHEKSLSFPEAIVAYIDILGFSRKKDDDMEISLMDFSGPLTLAADCSPKVRFNVFSDCAFLSTRKQDAADLVSALRFSFNQWVSDGILVRAGVAIGTYRETKTSSTSKSPKNFIGSFFFGSAVTAAVQLEASGCGALLFTNIETAGFLANRYNEPIFELDRNKVIGWFSDDSSLFWFTGISLLRWLRLLSTPNKAIDPGRIFLNNLRYSFTAASNELIPRSLVLAILESVAMTPETRRKAMRILGIKNSSDSGLSKQLINVWRTKRKEMEILQYLADSDSSIATSER